MFDLPLHPKIVHLPIAFAMLMPLLSGGVLLAWLRDWLPRRTFVIVAGVQMLLVLSGFAALASADGDEAVVERVVSHALIHAHEEAAQSFVAVAVAVMLCAFFACWVKAEKLARTLAALTVVGSLVALALAIRAGHMGGQLVYRHGAGAAFSSAGAPPAAEAAHDDED